MAPPCSAGALTELPSAAALLLLLRSRLAMRDKCRCSRAAERALRKDTTLNATLAGPETAVVLCEPDNAGALCISTERSNISVGNTTPPPPLLLLPPLLARKDDAGAVPPRSSMNTEMEEKLSDTRFVRKSDASEGEEECDCVCPASASDGVCVPSPLLLLLSCESVRASEKGTVKRSCVHSPAGEYTMTTGRVRSCRLPTW